MPALIFPLRHVPDDEAAEVRAMLAEHGFETYETEPSPFGVHAGAIWLRDESGRERAQSLLDGYQQERRERARAERRSGGGPTGSASFIRFVRTRPAAALLLALALLGVLVVSAWPFFAFRSQ